MKVRAVWLRVALLLVLFLPYRAGSAMSMRSEADLSSVPQVELSQSLDSAQQSGEAEDSSSRHAVEDQVQPITVPSHEVHVADRDNVDPVVSMGNPAAIYCRDLGYPYTVAESSGQRGVCHLPDGTACDAWSFLQGKCGQRYSWCVRQGYGIRTVSDGQGTFSPEYAVCVAHGGTVLGDVTALSRLDDKVLGCGGTVVEEAASTVIESPEYVPLLDFAPPASFDWRDHAGTNWTTPVKNQAQCGSCWAFAAAGVAEAMLNIANDDATLDRDLSEQYLVADCLNWGTCCGGNKATALSNIRDSGIPDESCMPYVDGTSGYDGSTCSCPGSCSADCAYSTGGNCSDTTCSDRCADWASRLQHINSVGSVPSDVQAMQKALVEIGPLAVSMGMGTSFGGAFDGDIYRCTDDGGTNHAVVIVGYDDTEGYWWVRNSWGSSWNGDGHFKVGFGECAIERYPYYADATITPTLLYVDADATGAATGLSWTDAYTSVQDALDVANAWGNKPYEIWVAEGVYYPDQDRNGDHVTNAVTETFSLRYNNVLLYGGFAGGEATREQRDWESNVTVLSGDIDGNDVTDGLGIVIDTADVVGSNAYHVLSAVGGSLTIARFDGVIDGFTITAGQADSDPSGWRGGGAQPGSYSMANMVFSGNLAGSYGGAVYISGNSPTLTHVTFRGNLADYGGALYISYGSPTLTHVDFRGNSADYGGALYISSSGSPALTHVTMYGNAASYGGAMRNWGATTLIGAVLRDNSAGSWGGALRNSGHITLTNVTLSGNSAPWGGAVYNSGGITLTNSILWSNTATNGPQMYNDGGSTSYVRYSDIQDSNGSGASWDAGLGTDGGGNVDSSPVFVDAAGGNLRLQQTSPCIDAGDNNALPSSVTSDLDGSPRRADVPAVIDTGVGPAPVVDMGAYEVQPPPDLVIEKTASPTDPAPGDAVVYVLSFANVGAAEVVDVVITDVVPISVTVSQVISHCDVPVVQAVSGVYTYTWYLASLDVGQSGAITLNAVLSDPLPGGTVFTNTVRMASATEEPYTDNNVGAAGVTVRNWAPQAQDDTYAVVQDTVLGISAPGILANDTDGNLDVLTSVKESDPAHGMLALADDGSFVYTPSLDHSGEMTFTYHATDALSSSNSALVTITVSHAPIQGLEADNSSPTPLGYATTLTATLSRGSSVAWDWSLGDGASRSGAPVVQHVYESVGVYTAVVTASNSSGTFTATTAVTITQPVVDLDPAYSADEGAGSATITVTMSAASGVSASIVYSTMDGTALDGSDYKGQTGLLVFDPGETEQTFDVPILDDSVYEGDETVLLLLSNPTNTGVGRVTSVLTIVDDESSYDVYLPLVIRE